MARSAIRICQAVQASFQPASSRLESRSRLFSMDILRKSGIKGDIFDYSMSP